MPKYAPANSDGEKPYVVVGRRWAVREAFLVWADSAADARYKSGFRGTAEYVISVHRATPNDVEVYS